jgi:pseudaminic acid biosynthesis-associated methylase
LDKIFENNVQLREFWAGKFGDEYVDRSNEFEKVNRIYKENTGISLEQVYQKFFDKIDKDAAILELGCNVGLNLNLLQRFGFRDLTGVELNKKAYETAIQYNSKIKFINSSIEDFASNDLYDVVFTAGVLIHINPTILPAVVKKMIGLTRKYIFGFEYFSENPIEVEYRGYPKALWKQDFVKLFLEAYPGLEIVMQEKFHYKKENLTDVAYLLRKLS